MSLAKKAGASLGLPPEWIYAQWAHESDAFSSELAVEDYNLAGLTNVGGGYASYDSYEDFADNYVSFLKHYPVTLGSKNINEFASNLSAEGYYTDSVSNYLSGLNYRLQEAELSSGGGVVDAESRVKAGAGIGFLAVGLLVLFLIDG
jgi:flagellum-specific peptidoglycan hydrolase FlgJ